jgi:predicted O-methyltransferase YrrM
MELVNPLAEKYAQQFTTPTAELLHHIHQQSEQHAHAHMLSSEVQGSLLSFISGLVQPKYILEIGTFTGYSALCLCTGLQPGGELHTIELREADAAAAKANFKLAGKDNEIHLHIGDAREIIPTLQYKWDIVFIDADKGSYITYYELALERLQEGGIIIADNVLFHGQVLEEKISNKSAKAIHAFNQHVASDERTEQVLLTMRDGLLFIKKKHIAKTQH